MKRLNRAGLRVGYSAAQVGPDLLIQTLPGIAGSHGDPDPARRHPDLRADLQQLGADGRHVRLRQLGGLQSQPPQSADQHIRHRGQIEAHLIRSHGLGTDPIGK